MQMIYKWIWGTTVGNDKYLIILAFLFSSSKASVSETGENLASRAFFFASSALGGFFFASSALGGFFFASSSLGAFFFASSSLGTGESRSPNLGKNKKCL